MSWWNCSAAQSSPPGEGRSCRPAKLAFAMPIWRRTGAFVEGDVVHRRARYSTLTAARPATVRREKVTEALGIAIADGRTRWRRGHTSLERAE